MKPSIYFITLVVNNLNKAIAFYQEGLGLNLAIKGPKAGELTFGKFDIQPGLSLVVVTEKQFKELTNVESQGVRGSQVAFSIPKPTEEAVRNTYTKAMELGGRSLMTPENREWGYTASMLDPDDNIIELVFDQDAPDIQLTD